MQPNTFHPITIRLAHPEDVEGAKAVADRHRKELGFVRVSILREAQQKGWLLVAAREELIVGFANFRIRRDNNGTLYEIAVDAAYRNQKIGKRLIQRFTWMVNVAGGDMIRLKCLQSTDANQFYKRLRFEKIGTETGRKQPLNVWHYNLPPLRREFHMNLNGLSGNPIPDSSPHFFAAVTMGPGEIRKVYELWHTHAHDFFWPRGKPNPFQRLLISPVLASPKTLAFIRELKRTGETELVMFDSGGFFVQKGDITYSELTSKLLDIYRAEDWADIYVLPDNPPLSGDAISTAEDKIRETIEGSMRFAYQLPLLLRSKVMPVVHAINLSHLSACLQSYEPLIAESQRIGFGSFATSGATNSINRINADALEMLGNLISQRPGCQVHAFGIATPPAIFCFAMVGVSTFDSSGWMRSGGYGEIFLPFMSRKTVDCRTRVYTRIYKDTLEPLKFNTGHSCPFCASFDELSDRRGRWLRILHNFTVMAELETYHRTPQWELLKEHASRYYRILEKTGKLD